LCPQNPIKTKGMLDLVGGNWKDYLIEAMSHQSIEFELHEKTGRPLGTDRFMEKAEKLLNRELKKKKPGPKVKER